MDVEDVGVSPPPRRRRPTKAAVVGIAVIAALPLMYFAFGTYQFYGYSIGTPTTVTVVDCRASRSTRGSGVFRALSSRRCKATWSVRGETHTGAVMGPRGGFDVGSPVNARVTGNTAFTLAGVAWEFLAGVLALVLMPVPFLLFWVFGTFLGHVVRARRPRT